MYYIQSIILDRPIGNNTFVYDKRKDLFGKAQIIVPQLIQGTLDNVQLGEAIVFAEEVYGDLREFRGLRHIVRLQTTDSRLQKIPIYIMDNHNHALYCRYREFLAGRIQKGLSLIHIDQHSDMKDPVGWIDVEKEHDGDYIATYVNEVCTIADFIQPALKTGLVGECVQVRSEYGLLHYDMFHTVISSEVERSHISPRFLDSTSFHSKGHSKGYILDIDIDFWAEEMGIEEFDRTIQKTRQLIAGASMVTIATSPCFIEQERGVEIVKLLLL